MAYFTSSAGTKRVRPWDSCHDVEKLKEMLEDREAEIESFKMQKALPEDDVVKKLQETLQEKDARIEQLMHEVEKSKTVSAFGEVFTASSNMALQNAGADARKAMPAFSKGCPPVLKVSKSMRCESEGCQVSMEHACEDVKKAKVFPFAREASRTMKCGTDDSQVSKENVSVDSREGVVRRCVGLQKSRSVVADSEEDTDCDKQLASDSSNDEDYCLKEVSADSTDEEEYTAAFTKQKTACCHKAMKTNTNGHSCVEAENVGNVLSLRASIQKQIVSQMVYRRGLKHRTSKAVAEVPNLSEAHMKAILGDDLFAKATCKGKLIQVTASDDDIRALFQGSFTKRLRYGAVLTLCDGLKFAFTKATGVLKVTGVFSM